MLEINLKLQQKMDNNMIGVSKLFVNANNNFREQQKTNFLKEKYSIGTFIIQIQRLNFIISVCYCQERILFIIKPMSKQIEDYNWKFPTREGTMYLSTMQKFKRPATSHNRTMDVSDIDGAQSKYLTKKQFVKQSYALRNDDIEGSQTKPTKILNVQDRRLKNDDIVGTSQNKKFQTLRRTNPLDPHYQLPVVEYVPYEQPKFVRDSIPADDIEGTKTKPTKVIRDYVKQEVKQKQKPVIHGQNYMDVKDINLYRMKYVSKRETNPLQPIYDVMDENNKVTKIGQINKSRPKVSQKLNVPDFMNNIGDIEGTSPVRFFNKHLIFNKDGQLPVSKQTNYVKDIAGTQVSSKKKGIVSNRITNPLSPQYEYPGHSVKEAPVNTRPKTAAQRFDKFIS